MNWTQEKVVKSIIECEKKNDLFNIKYKNIKIYQYCRMRIYFSIMHQLNLFRSAKKHRDTKKILKNFPSYIANISRANEFYGLDTTDILVIPHHRRILYKNQFIDIYTNSLIKSLEGLKYKTLEIPSNFEYKYPIKHTQSTIFFDYFYIKKYLYAYIASYFNNTVNSSVIAIEESFQDTFNKKIKLFDLIKNKLLLSLHGLNISLNFLKKIKPKVIISVVPYSHPEIIHAAKILKIPSIELQHSIFSNYHVGYNYPNSKNGSVDIFPDQFYSYGDYWEKEAHLPIDSKNILSIGSTWMEKQIIINSTNKNISSKSILFISQNTIGKKLFAVALELANNLPHYKIYYKLHPKENLRKNSCYDIEYPNNLIILQSSETSIYELFSKVEWIIGVFSTSIYEGLAFGKSAIVMQLPGYEAMLNLIQSGNYVRLAKSTGDIMKYIQSEECSKYTNLENIYKKNASDNLKYSVLNMI